METDITKELDKLKAKNSAKLKIRIFLESIRASFDNQSVLAKIRNALIIFLALIIIFKLTSFVAGIYITGESYASFIAYSSFFFLVIGGLSLSVYFPLKYKGESDFGINMEKLENGKKGKNELKRMLKNERKNVINVSKENHEILRKLQKMTEKCERIEEQKKELMLNESSSKKKFGRAVLPQKNEVIKEEGGIKMNTPKIKTIMKHKNLAKKFKKLPKQQGQRIELYRDIARNVQSKDGSFSISQIMEGLIGLFRSETDENRTKMLKEIEVWVNEDAYTPLVRTEKGIKYHRIIK